MILVSAQNILANRSEFAPDLRERMGLNDSGPNRARFILGFFDDTSRHKHGVTDFCVASHRPSAS